MGKFDQVLIDMKDITTVIPQKAPIVMIDKLRYSDETKTVCSLTVREDNIFTKNGRLSEPGLVENIAQTAAARMGYIAMTTKNEVPIGFIAAIKDLRIYALPEVNSELLTEIEITNHVIGITIIEGKVTLNGQILAQCEMKIFISKGK